MADKVIMPLDNSLHIQSCKSVGWSEIDKVGSQCAPVESITDLESNDFIAVRAVEVITSVTCNLGSLYLEPEFNRWPWTRRQVYRP